MSMAQKVSYAEFVEVWNDFAEILDSEQPRYR